MMFKVQIERGNQTGPWAQSLPLSEGNQEGLEQPGPRTLSQGQERMGSP